MHPVMHVHRNWVDDISKRLMAQYRIQRKCDACSLLPLIKGLLVAVVIPGLQPCHAVPDFSVSCQRQVCIVGHFANCIAVFIIMVSWKGDAGAVSTQKAELASKITFIDQRYL